MSSHKQDPLSCRHDPFAQDPDRTCACKKWPEAVERVTGLPTDAAARKAIPIYSGFIRYFPKAIAAVAELSRIGNEQHNAGKPLHWDRSKSGDELDAAMRHLMEAGTVDSDKVLHSTKLAWRAMANLEKEIELLLERHAACTDAARIERQLSGEWIAWNIAVDSRCPPSIFEKRIQIRTHGGDYIKGIGGAFYWYAQPDSKNNIVAYRVLPS